MHLSNDGNPDPLEMENFMLKSVLGEINTKLDEVFLIHPQIKKAVSKWEWLNLKYLSITYMHPKQASFFENLIKSIRETWKIQRKQK